METIRKILIVVLIIGVLIAVTFAKEFAQLKGSPTWTYSIFLLLGAVLIIFLFNKFRNKK